MFELNGTHIMLTQGDTGLLTVLTGGEHVMTENDKALFTVRRRSGGVLCEMILQPEADKVQIPFVNDLTDGWKPDEYEWDIRFVLDAVMEDGKLVDGREVITPMRPGKMTIVKAVGKV